MLNVLVDPLTRGPFWASSILACMLTLMGLIVFYGKKPLIGEVISHCSYPGAMLGLLISLFFVGVENPILIGLITFMVASCGFYVLSKLEKRLSSDASMTLVLSSFFGLGVLLSSIIQQINPKYYRLAQGYLFGQVSTMTDKHIVIYAVCFLAVIAFIALFFSRLKLRLFDPIQSFFFSKKWMDLALELLVCLVIVLGIRGIGVVLVSSFFVAPAAFSLRFSKTLKQSFIIATLFAFAMNACAFFIQIKAPLGPIIVLFMSFGALLSFKRSSYASLR